LKRWPRKHTPVSYIKDCISLIKKYFSSISIEIYPLRQEEYRELIEAGADGLTIYQEVYNKGTYKTVHPKGPKSNYQYRLEAAERAAKAGIHSVSIGALLGLSPWRQEAFFTGLHGQYLQDNYPALELTLSTPRIRPYKGTKTKIYEVTEKNLVQAMLAYKIFLQRAGINITTRESAEFRDNLIPLGVTKMSAAVSTQVGGHSSEDKSTSQFDTADGRTVEEIRCAIRQKGYNPIFKDWEPF
jgi:2-iminoacetate synthase